MTADFTWTRPRLRVLRALLTADDLLWAVGLSQALGMSHGTVYDTFRRLYDVGWAVGITEDNTGKGRPARVLYRLTGEGRKQAAALLGESERKD